MWGNGTSLNYKKKYVVIIDIPWMKAYQPTEKSYIVKLQKFENKINQLTLGVDVPLRAAYVLR